MIISWGIKNDPSYIGDYNYPRGKSQPTSNVPQNMEDDVSPNPGTFTIQQGRSVLIRCQQPNSEIRSFQKQQVSLMLWFFYFLKWVWINTY